MKIDFSQVVTAEARRQAEMEERSKNLKTECSKRVGSVIDSLTMINIQGAATAGLLSDDDMATFKAGLEWIFNTLHACRTAIEKETEPEWPNVPSGLKDLAARY